MVRRILAVAALLAATFTAAIAAPASSQVADPGSGPDGNAVKPMIFVHGFMGSGQQFESQALRFTSNGYPAELIHVFEHDSLAYPGSQQQVWAGIDAAVESAIASSGSDQVYLLGHSQGTGVVQGYLNSDPARAARVAAYVNLDGGAGGTVPASVRTLAIWGEGSADRQIPGATNVQFADQAHTEVVNSPETFQAIYEFFLGEEPQFTEIVREPADQIQVSGRVVLFPENAGAAGAQLAVYELDAATGARVGGPVAQVSLTGDGSFGPIDVDGDRFHEFAVTRPGEPTTHHIHLQPFVRSSRWVRILTSEPDGLANSFWEPSSHAQNLVVMRNEEWWADQGARNDSLAVNGQEVLSPSKSPRTNRTIGIFLHDAGVDRRTDLTAEVPPTGLPFLIGVDFVIPGGDPAPGTTSVRARPRNGVRHETVCVPAYSSLAHRTSIQFNAFHVVQTPDGATEPAHPDPTCAEAPAPVDPPAPTTPTTVDPGSGPRPAPAAPARPRSGSPSYTG